MVYLASERRRKNYQKYVPKLFPPHPEIVSWGAGSKPTIIQLFDGGMSVDDISRTTGNRRAFVRSVIYRYTNPEEFVISTRNKPTKQIVISCYACDNTTSASRWFRNGCIGRICTDCHRILFKPSHPAKPRLLQRVTIRCASCNEERSIYPSEQRKNRKYCSKNCYWKARYHNIPSATSSQGTSTVLAGQIVGT